MTKQKHIISTLHEPQKTILVGLVLPKQQRQETLVHLDELSQLALTAQLVVKERFVQAVERINIHTCVGKGKAEEIGAYITTHCIEKVIFDDDLTPGQVHKLQAMWNCEVIDRTGLILEIFAMHARTAPSKVQVELAQYQYLLPRLTGMWTHHSRQRGGVKGMRGPGEKELETDRRIAQQRIQHLKKQLIHIEKQSKDHRNHRSAGFNVALVGYTNAGKSTLMQTLSKRETLVEDQLFATLSPIVREVVVERHRFLLTDTIGFLRKLPHSLVACFRSTLALVNQAHLLLHIIDIAHPHYLAHIEVVKQTLQEIGAAHVPSILVLNKADAVDYHDPSFLPNEDLQKGKIFWEKEKMRLEKQHNLSAVFCIANQKEGTHSLRKKLVHELDRLAPQTNMLF